MYRIDIHSLVDVITNSSTIIYTYQDSVKQAKELVQEVLKMTASDKTPDDVFYYGTFCDSYTYTESLDNYSEEEIREIGCPEGYKEKESWVDGLIHSILEGEIEKPGWMSKAEKEDYNYMTPSYYLYLIPKDDAYIDIGKKILSLLNSVSVDGVHDG